MKIGLTGGIGCGKSTALAMFADLGARTFESDACVRELLSRDPDVIAAVRDAFGPDIIDSEGMVDRASLGRMVFDNSDRIRVLEAILHPRVREVWTAVLQDEPSLAVIEIPLLFEKNLENAFDFSICLATEPNLQLQRLQKRGWSEPHIKQRLSRQLSLDEKVRRADVVLWNNGSLNHLREQIYHTLISRGYSPHECRTN